MHTMTITGARLYRAACPVVVAVGRVLVAAVRWLLAHLVVTLPGLLVTGVLLVAQAWWPAVGVTACLLLAGVWNVTVCRAWPVACDRAADPVRRIVWALWWSLRWSYAARAVGLGSWEYDKQGSGRRWVGARAWPLVTRSGLRLRVRVPAGLDAETALARADALASAMRAYSVVCEYVDASHVRVRLVMRDALASPVAAPRPSGSGVVRIGTDMDGHPVTVDPIASAHVAIQGGTRSGKSTTTYGFLSALAGRADVVVVGCDPSGILLGPWREGRGGAWIACGTDDLDRHARVLEAIVAGMDKRIQGLAVTDRDKLDTFDGGLPVWWVVLEELPGLLAAARGVDNRLASRIDTAVGRLLREGHKAGVRVLGLAQRFSFRVLDPDDRAQYGCRISHAVDTTSAAELLHEGAGIPTASQMRTWAPGMGLIEAPGRPLSRWRACYLSYGEYLRRVRAGLAVTHGTGWVAPELPPVDAVPARRPRARAGRALATTAHDTTGAGEAA